MITEPLGLKVLDFGSAILVQWELVDRAVGYHVTFQQNLRSGVVVSESFDRTASQNYLILPGELSVLNFIVRISNFANEI